MKTMRSLERFYPGDLFEVVEMCGRKRSPVLAIRCLGIGPDLKFVRISAHQITKYRGALDPRGACGYKCTEWLR